MRRKVYHMQICAQIGVVVGLLLAAACTKAPRDQLEALGLAFTPESFVAAVRASNHEAVGLYLAAGMDADSTDASGVPALSHAVQQADPALVSLLVEHGANVENPVADAGMTALMLAATKGSEDIVRTLLAAGADVDKRDAYGNTALLDAAASGHLGVAALLLDAGADVNRPTDRKITPLMAAVMNRHEDLAARLLESGARPDVRELDHGRSALGIAAATGQSGMVAMLLANGADPNRVDHDGLNPLIHAAGTGTPDTVRAFLAHGVHPDITGPNRQTALSWAVLRGDREIVELLLRAGSNPNLADSDGVLPLQIALERDQPALAALLRRHGARADLDQARRSLALLRERPARLPRDWYVADPFDDKSRYFPSYAVLSTTFNPPLTQRALLRSGVDDQSQIMIVLGKAPDWQGRVDQALQSLHGGLPAVSRGTLELADGIEIPFELVEQPGGLLAGEPTTYLFASRKCGEWLLAIDAGGSTERFDSDLVLSVLGDVELSLPVACDD